jgi:hypothetical protein
MYTFVMYASSPSKKKKHVQPGLKNYSKMKCHSSWWLQVHGSCHVLLFIRRRVSGPRLMQIYFLCSLSLGAVTSYGYASACVKAWVEPHCCESESIAPTSPASTCFLPTRHHGLKYLYDLKTGLFYEICEYWLKFSLNLNLKFIRSKNNFNQ